MSIAGAVLGQDKPLRAAPGLSMRIGWRNLWRNKRRTWLTSGGIAFAVLLVVFSMSVQLGSYDSMMDSASSLMTGHIQIQTQAYVEQDRFEDTIANASALRGKILEIPGVVAVAPRVEAYALVSAGERSFGAQVMGVDADLEDDTVRFLSFINEGRVFATDDEVILGRALARNLGVGLGDEIILLGTGKQGGIAALALNVSGIFESGFSELDRNLIWAPISAVQSGFSLNDEVHTFAIRVSDLHNSRQVAALIKTSLGNDTLAIRNWDDVMPEVKQAIEVDKLGGYFFYWIIMILVVFSIVNSFIMTVFERVREFGMLLAIGMRPWSIVALVQWEALFMWTLGAAIGLGLAISIVWWLSIQGIYMGEAMDQLAAQVYLPSRLYPALKLNALLISPLVMLIGTQIAALLPCLRIRRLNPVEALRDG